MLNELRWWWREHTPRALWYEAKWFIQRERDDARGERDSWKDAWKASAGTVLALERQLDEEITKRIEAIDKWDTVFREMEGLASTFLEERNEAQLELTDAQETIDAMRAEGCAAAGVLENIFNGMTAVGVNHGDPTIAKATSIVASAIVDVPRCEHKEELKSLKELAYNYLDFTPGSRNNRCLTCGEQWYPNKCEGTCPRLLLFKVTREANDTSIVWLDLCDERDKAVAALELVREWRGRDGALLELDRILKAATDGE